jgi:hypothetical protein
MNNLIKGPNSWKSIDNKLTHISEFYIKDLGITRRQLETLHVLDACGGDGILSAIYSGGNVVSTDIAAKSYENKSKFSVDVDVLDTPFPDETFDMVISAQGFPKLFAIGYRPKEDIGHSKIGGDYHFNTEWVDEFLEAPDPRDLADEKTETFFREVLRLLTKNGEGRFAPIYTDEKEPWLEEYMEELTEILKNLQEKYSFIFKFEEITSYRNVPGERSYRLVINKNTPQE